MPKTTMNPWTPTTDPRTLRRLGKLQEELGELQAATARTSEAKAAHKPGSGLCGVRLDVAAETADVLAQIELTIAHFQIQAHEIESWREALKPLTPFDCTTLLPIQLGRLQAIAARCVIQGIDEIDPSSGSTNRKRIVHGFAELLLLLQWLTNWLELPADWIAQRVAEKKRQMSEWEAFFADPPPDGPPFGIIDPDYAIAYTKTRIAAWQYGYAIALQGSFTRDLDLLAVPWTERACDLETLVAAIEYRTGLKRQAPPSDKPHGRKSVSLLFPGFEDPRWVDLSILPRAAAPLEAKGGA